MKVILQMDKQDSFLQDLAIQNNRGQSTIEFIVTFSMIVTMIFVFVKIAFNATNGFLIHYATYSASRVLYTYDSLSNTPASVDSSASQEAKKMFRKTMSGAPIPENFSILPDATANKVFIGYKAIKKDKFGISDIIGGKKDIKYVSESFLGKAPPKSECSKRTCYAINDAAQTGQSGDSCSENTNITLFDNGC